MMKLLRSRDHVVEADGVEQLGQHSLTVIRYSSCQSDELSVRNLEKLEGVIFVLVEELVIELVSDDYSVSIYVLFGITERSTAFKHYVRA